MFNKQRIHRLWLLVPQVRTTETLMGKAPAKIDQSLGPKRGLRKAPEGAKPIQ